MFQQQAATALGEQVAQSPSNNPAEPHNDASGLSQAQQPAQAAQGTNQVAGGRKKANLHGSIAKAAQVGGGQWQQQPGTTLSPEKKTRSTSRRSSRLNKLAGVSSAGFQGSVAKRQQVGKEERGAIVGTLGAAGGNDQANQNQMPQNVTGDSNRQENRFNTTQREPHLKQILQQPEDIQQNTVSYLRPVKLEGKDAVPIQVQNWTQGGHRRIPEDAASGLLPGGTKQGVMDNKVRAQYQSGQYSSQRAAGGGRGSAQFKTKLSQKQLIQKFDQLKARQGGKKKGAAQFEEYDTMGASAKIPKKKLGNSATRGSPPKSPQTPSNKRDGKRQTTQSPLASAKRRQGKGGYLDALADKEAKQISMNSLQVGEEFEKDIKNIIEIIDGVEKNMCPQRLNSQFVRNANISQNRRNIDMSRTIQAQQNHQTNFAAKQAYLKMQYHSLNASKPMSQSVAHRFGHHGYGPQMMQAPGQQILPQPFLLHRDPTEKHSLQQQMRQGFHGNTVAARYNQQDRLATPNLLVDNGKQADGLGSGFDQHSKYRQNILSGKTRGTFRIREGKRRPLTTKNVPNLQKQAHMKMEKSLQGRGQAGSLSGQFNVNFRGDSKNTAGERFERERSGGENTSDQMTGDNVTSHVTVAGNPAGLGKFSSKNLNHSRTNVGRYVTGGPSSRLVLANNPDVQSSNMAGTLANSNTYWVHPGNQEYEIFSDQLQYQVKNNQEFYMMSPKIVGGPAVNNNGNNRIASAKDVIQGLSYSGDAVVRNINNTQSKDQAARKPDEFSQNQPAVDQQQALVQIDRMEAVGDQKFMLSSVAQQEDQMQTLGGLPTGASRQSPNTQQTYDPMSGLIGTAQNTLNPQIYSSKIPGTISVSAQSQNAGGPLQRAFSHQLYEPPSANGYNYGGLADNMTINEQLQDSKMHGRSPKGNQGPGGNKLVMQVNKYIPHYQRIPPKLEKRDLKLFQEEYRYKDAQLYKQAHAEVKEGAQDVAIGRDPQALLIMEDMKADRHQKIQGQIINFDKVLLECFFGNRERKYYEQYKNRQDMQEEEHGTDVTEKLDDESSMPQKQSRITRNRQRTVRKSSTASESGIVEPGYDSDEERENAHRMFIDDLQTLRKFFIATVEEHVRSQEEMVFNFNKERDFFLQSAQKSKEDLRGLQETIDGLQSEILEERDYSQKIWADEQVSLMCQKAMFTFKFMQQNQANKIQGLDIRNHPEGHIVVSKEEQDAVIKNKLNSSRIVSPKETTPVDSGVVSESQNVYKNDGIQNPSSDDDRQSEVSALPSPTQEKHEIEIQNLKWQIDYEKKLHREMTQLLENKVSDLMAQVRYLEKDIKGLNEKIAEQSNDKEVLNQQILKLEARIQDQRATIVDLQNQTEELKQKGGALSQSSFDIMESKLTVERQMNQQKTARIQQLEADLSRTVAALKDFHSRLVKLDNFAKFQTAQLEEQVNIKILEQSNRIQQVTETFKDALLLSNKTYFLEEVNKQKTEKKKLVQNAIAAGSQAEILQRKVGHIQQKLEAISQDNKKLKQNLQEALKAKETALQQLAAQSVTPPEQTGTPPKKQLRDVIRGSFLSSMRSARKPSFSGLPTGAQNDKTDGQSPFDIDKFGINSPKAAQQQRIPQIQKQQSPGGVKQSGKHQGDPSEKSDSQTPIGGVIQSQEMAGQGQGTPGTTTALPGFSLIEPKF